MKANELMIGDWIRFYLDADSGEPLIHNERVKNIYGDSINCEIRDNRIIRYKKLSYYEPIPLTAEILEKNGWKRNGDYPEYNLPINGVVGWSMDTHMIRVRNNADFETNDIFVRCDYVHELQHALRLCGLNELADNFKV